MNTRLRWEAEASARIAVAPGVLRRLYWWLVSAACTYGAWVWLGNSGAGLAVLWCAAHRPWHCVPFLLQPSAAAGGSVLMEPWRLVMVIGGERLEVFRDEVSGRDWAWLRSVLKLRAE